MFPNTSKMTQRWPCKQEEVAQSRVCLLSIFPQSAVLSSGFNPEAREPSSPVPHRLLRLIAKQPLSMAHSGQGVCGLMMNGDSGFWKADPWDPQSKCLSFLQEPDYSWKIFSKPFLYLSTHFSPFLCRQGKSWSLLVIWTPATVGPTVHSSVDLLRQTLGKMKFLLSHVCLWARSSV